MKILHFLQNRRNKQFVSEISFLTNRGSQSHLAIEKLVSLRDLNVEEEDMLSIDFCFSAATAENMQELAKALQALDYVAENKKATGKKGLFTVSGQSVPVKMMHEVLRKWAEDMCNLGYKYDCDFVSWEIKMPS